MSGRVATWSQDGVLEVTFENARRRNALSRSLLSALSRAIDDARADDVRVVVLAGAGDGFSAGADLADLKGAIDDRAMDEAIERAARIHSRLPGTGHRGRRGSVYRRRA